jgi:hypothetical protein
MKKQITETKKPLSYYHWETKKVSILWHGKVQPLGMFFSAEDAMKEILKQSAMYGNAKEYQINANGEILNVIDYI